MNPKSIAHVLGTLLLVTALALVFPVVCSLLYGGEGDLWPLAMSAGACVVLGTPLRLGCTTRGS